MALRPSIKLLPRSLHPISASSASATCRIALHPTRLPLAQERCAHQKVLASSIPSPTPFVPDVPTFLKLIGRSSPQFASKLPTWETLFGSSSEHLRKLGIEPPRARRYILHWREKFRRGEFGPGGDLKHVAGDGRAELRVVLGGDGSSFVVNVPASEEEAGPNEIEAGMTEAEPGKPATSTTGASPQTTQQQAARQLPAWMLPPPADAVKVPWARVVHPGVVRAAFSVPVKGTEGRVACIQARDGMWENKRGQKVGGGERFMRRQKTLATRRKRGIVT